MVARLAGMGAQKVATGIGLAAVVVLLVRVGLRAVLPPGPVAEVEIVVPAGDESEPTRSPEPVPTAPPARTEDDDEPDDDDGLDDDDDDDGDDEDD
jgi:hypothetical protein